MMRDQICAMRRTARGALAGGLVCATVVAVPAAAQTRVPDWELRGRVEMRPMSPGECAFVTIFVKDARGKLITRPDGTTIGPGDFELALSGPGAASFKWERNTPNWYKVCATFAAGPDRADIVITYPRSPLPDEEVYPGVAFSAVLPVFRGSGGGVPDYSLLTLRDVGGVVAAAAPGAAPPVALPDPNRPPTQIGTVQTPAPAQPAVALPDPNRPPTQIGTVRTPPPPAALPAPNQPPAPVAGTPSGPGTGASGGNGGALPPPPPPVPGAATTPPSGFPPGTIAGAVSSDGTVTPPSGSGTPPSPGAGAPPPPVRATPGKYRIRLMGFRANHQTVDDPLNRDGWGDEIYAATFVSVIDRNTLATRESRLLTTQTYGQPIGGQRRMRVDGGIVNGTVIPMTLMSLLRTPAEGAADVLPQQLFQGVIAATDAIVIAPSLWEWDGDGTAFGYWKTHQAPVETRPAGPAALIPSNNSVSAAIATGDARWRTMRDCIVTHANVATQAFGATPPGVKVDAGQDRPLMNDGHRWCQPYVVLTRESIDRLMTQTIGAQLAGVLELNIIERDNTVALEGDYTLYIKVEPVP
jgi:hypothetical protein